MIYLFDTDHLSILQRKTGLEYVKLSSWMRQYSVLDFACSVVSLHEQLLGAHNFINRANNSVGLQRGYELLARLPRDYQTFGFLKFDAPSMTIYEELTSQNLRIGTMDLRIAAIALAHDLIILTRNHRDFGRVPGLKIEDRTV